MNLLYITAQNLGRPGGARSHVLGFCDAMSRRGVRVGLIAGVGPGENGQGRKTILGRMGSFLRMKRQAIRSIESGWPDAVYYRKGLVDPGFHYAFKRFKGPVYVEINGSPAADFHKPARYALTKVANLTYGRKLARADLVVSVSSGLREYVLREYPAIRSEKVIVVQNGVDTEIFHPIDRNACRWELGIDPGLFVVLFSGRIAKWHGLETAVQAMEMLSQRYAERIRLYVVGDGPYAQAVKDEVKGRGLEDAVGFTGAVPPSRVAAYIGAADICIAPFTARRNDSIGISPLKVFEYIACGRPVVCSDVKGIREIAEEAGSSARILLVRPDDARALAAAIEKSMSLPPEAPQGAESLHETLSWYARSQGIYDRLMRDLSLS